VEADDRSRAKPRTKMREYMQVALDARGRRNRACHLSSKDMPSGRVIGSNPVPQLQTRSTGGSRFRIYPWLTIPYQGRGVNAQAKLLMLRQRVRDARLRARLSSRRRRRMRDPRRAIERLGATHEGILRSYMISGRRRETARRRALQHHRIRLAERTRRARGAGCVRLEFPTLPAMITLSSLSGALSRMRFSRPKTEFQARLPLLSIAVRSVRATQQKV